MADAMLLIASCCAIALVICDTIAYKKDAMHDFTHTTAEIWKIRFAVNYFFDTGMYFPKFSIIAFYYTLVPATQPKMRIALYALTAITVCSGLVTFFDATFWCGLDISSNWSTKPGACRAYDSMVMMRIHWSLNFSTEVLNVVFPFPIIRDVKLPRRREKIGLAVILGLGVITIAVSIGRFTNMVMIGNGFSNYLWAESELCVSIMVVALTSLRPLLRKLAHMINSSIHSSDYKSGTPGYRSTDPRTRTARSRANHTQGSGAYWRSVTGTQHKANDDINGSEVQLNEMKGGKVLKTEEIRISSETVSHDGSTQFASGSGRPMGLEPAHMA